MFSKKYPVQRQCDMADTFLTVLNSCPREEKNHITEQKSLPNKMCINTINKPNIRIFNMFLYMLSSPVSCRHVMLCADSLHRLRHGLFTDRMVQWSEWNSFFVLFRTIPIMSLIQPYDRMSFLTCIHFTIRNHFSPNNAVSDHAQTKLSKSKIVSKSMLLPTQTRLWIMIMNCR